MIPSPTPTQARILWFSITALCIGVCLVLLGLVFWGLGAVINRLSAVLLPLAIGGVIACLLLPVVDWLQARGMRRSLSIWTVFLLGVLLVGLFAAAVVPRLVAEMEELGRSLPEYLQKIEPTVQKLAERLPIQIFPEGAKADPAASSFWQTESGEKFLNWVREAAPVAGQWFLAQFRKMASWFGLLAGLVLIPVYVYYFLLEQKKIERNWADYLPVRESKAKEELVFVLKAINERLVTFFRGQVLVAMTVGVLLTIGFVSIGLKHGIVLGVMAGILGIVPYLGVLLSLIPAVVLAIVQFGDWLHPLLVLGIFAVVQFLEGFVISPKIMGDRVGLHPLTIIIAVMVGTSLLGGILGGVLAIPMTAVLRELMFRYVWRKRLLSSDRQNPEPPPPAA